jgi:phosphinothricin acetyltransferase
VETNYAIRVAREEDAAEVLAIYKPYILETAVTFEETVPSLDVFSSRIAAIRKDCPFLVCEMNGKIAGYAYASSYRSRAAYRWNREVSVYTHPEFRRRNVAKALYQALFSILKMQGFTRLYAVITLPNDASVKLHESLGFRAFAVYENVGYKLGKWQHVGWWELVLTDDEQQKPVDPVLFENIASNKKTEKYLKDALSFLKI